MKQGDKIDPYQKASWNLLLDRYKSGRPFMPADFTAINSLDNFWSATHGYKNS